MRHVLTAAALLAAAPGPALPAQAPAKAPLPRLVSDEPAERHLRRVHQLTDGGENAEAYFSHDGRWLTFQSTREGRSCDQQYVMRLRDARTTRISTGTGKTTCGWFFPGNERLFFASSHAVDTACPPKPDPSKGYVWRLDPFDIYSVKRDGRDLTRLTNYGVYTAEGNLSPNGRTIVFTSLKDGDLEIYTMHADGSHVRRLTNTPGYDGGPWWSPDGTQIVYRAWHYGPGDSAALSQYQGLLTQRLVRPNRMELWVMNADGSHQRQITNLGGANFGPAWAPGGKQIVFASNHVNPRSRNFDLYLINLDGSGLEQVTFNKDFDGFPMFSPNGKQIVWASNRHDTLAGETNLFMADWVP